MNETPKSARPAPEPQPRPASPSLTDILALWQVTGRIEVIPLSTVADELARGLLSPLVEEVRDAQLR
jgi:hypothetical protein